MTLGTAMGLAAVASLSAALVFLALTWWQNREERVTRAFHEGQAKQTRKGKASATKCAAFVTTIETWLVRIVGGGAASKNHSWGVRKGTAGA